MEISDEEALDECYRTHAPALRSYLRRFVPAQDVEDMIQVVFADLWRSRRRYDPTRSQAAWVFAIAHRRAIDHLRVRRPATVPLDEVGDPPVPERPVADVLADRDRLGRALAALPHAQRQAIELAYFADLTQREIADRLRVPLGTVKARTTRGLRRLSALLAGLG
ncbi:RNA polymerase sigma factor [Nonomuraea gerenzanensis]|uniref:Putative RNA polymerase sigma factor n=1 Tax=Nonomuraea gerenzanensis TaxID=93944 RepID=A0A1M4EC34_9ACTN|nr:sigma-70 family RNA polymerase sigma factor [Nonomuraea gerenzanensis]UBU18487.1 sigma-70 family RNA polymerase sigma factor [Nonomuraea gerenzanensis]SBO96326.1 putative RNA polymerase sigma factor [Nonomuraea gerenzanensis]